MAEKRKGKQGFASMPRERVQAIARMGGKKSRRGSRNSQES